jgi:predicted AAA+ superfamily ATPase
MDIRRILVDQRRELEEKLKTKKIVKREFEEKAKEFINSKLIKVITGIRRCGKSFFTSLLLKDLNFAYVNFDERVLLSIEPEKIFSIVLEIYGDVKILFLDEIQNVEGWELWVNSLQRKGYNLIITGSNAKLLSKELATHLTGRHIPLEIFPFSFREFLLSRDFKEDLKTTKGESLVKHYLEEYLGIGGFPEVIVEKENPNIYLRNLFYDIVEKDVIARYKIAFKSVIRELAITLISNFTNYISFRKLKEKFELGSEHTIKNYLDYLKETYLFFFLNKFSFKPIEIEKSNKKIYCIDTGIINSVAIRFSENKGKFLENLVAIELLRRKSYWFNNWEIYYFKDYQQNEVDFLIKENLEIKQLIQVTYASSKDEIERREIKSLIKASELLKCKDLLIITWDYEDEIKENNKVIKCIPLWKWLLKV